MKRLEGITAFVAGGAGGIGSATSRRLAQEGARVCVADIDVQGVEALASELRASGADVLGLELDLESPASIKEAFKRASGALGPILRLHCNGAFVGMEMVEKDLDALTIDLATWEKTLRINLTSYLLCAREVLPAMAAAKEGAIVFTSSTAAYTGDDVRIAYGVSKAGMNQLVRHIAHRWGKLGIRANAVVPGLVLTPATENLPGMEPWIEATRSPRVGKPADIAAMVAMLMSRDGEWINGQILAVDGGLTLRQ